MYWLNAQTIIGIAVGSYMIGTVIGVYLASVSIFGAVVWLIAGGLVGVGSIMVAGKNWGGTKHKQK
ncbi:MAG: hypothetical protein ACR2NW_10745 [Thermodesulfobacteriota bacterium]